MIFKTLKSKILAIAIVTLTILLAAFTCYASIFKVKTQQLMQQNYGLSINAFVNKINKNILQIEDNSRELALIGSLFYKTDKDPTLTKQALFKIFESYPHSLGGGIWFEPYVINKNVKRTCFYMYRSKDNKLIYDENFASENMITKIKYGTSK